MSFPVRTKSGKNFIVDDAGCSKETSTPLQVAKTTSRRARAASLSCIDQPSYLYIFMVRPQLHKNADKSKKKVKSIGSSKPQLGDKDPMLTYGFFWSPSGSSRVRPCVFELIQTKLPHGGPKVIRPPARIRKQPSTAWQKPGLSLGEGLTCL